VTSSSPPKPGGHPIENGGRPPPDSVVVAKAPSGEIMFSNRFAERVVGHRLSEIADDFPMFHLDGRPYAFAERQVPRSLASGEEIIDEEFLGPAADGSRVCYRCSCWPVYDDGGEIVAAVAVTRDVTEQKRREKRLGYLAGLLENTEDAVVAMDERYLLTVWNQGAERLYGWRAEEVVGRHANEVARTNLSEEQRTELRRELVKNGRWRGDVNVIRKDGSTVDVELISVALREEQGEITGYLGIHRDIAERRSAQEETRRRAEQQALVADLGDRALASDDLQSVFDEAVGLVARTLHVELAGVAEMPVGSEEVILRAGVGWREGVVGSRIERGGRDSQAGYTLLRREPVIVEDQAADRRFKRSALAHAHGVVSALSVMIASSDEPFGVIAALSTSRRTFSPSEVSFVQAVATVLASAVERRQAQERLIEVRDAERRRIARDLHDEALQDLAYALALTAGRRSVSPGRPADDPLGDVVAAMTRAQEHVRGAIYDLRIGGEAHRPFADLLAGLAARHSAMTGEWDVELQIGKGLPADPLGAGGTEILRILGEALTNARRHSQAVKVVVRVWGAGGRVCAEVSDDGRGFDPAAVTAPNGTGIEAMRERADGLGGRIDIRSGPRAGTSVRVAIPLEAETEPVAADVRILLVEDHVAVRQAIAAAFERERGFRVIGQAGSLAEARTMLDRVDVAVLDLGLPDGSGTDLIEDLRSASPRAQTLVLSATVDRDAIARAVESGAAGVLNKARPLGDVVDAVGRLWRGERLLPMEEILELLRVAVRTRERERDDRQAIAQLTRRERDILQALADGLDSRAAAARLHISLRTQRNHMANILSKLGVHSQLQGLVLVLRYDVVTIRPPKNADSGRD
jgi:PAS domain S-box-containing protein